MKVKVNILKYRIKAEMSKKELAEKCDISNTYLGEVEEEKYMPSHETVCKIAEALEICPHTIVDYCEGCPGYKHCIRGKK